ncbi:glycosyltransferase [Caulobacter segnis]|nr:glycosyltransferase [Caulobacter segnis]
MAALTASGAEVVCVSPWKPGAAVEHRHVSLDGSLIYKALTTLKLSALLLQLRPDVVVSESALAPLSFNKYRLYHMIHDAKFATAHGRKFSRLAHLVNFLSARLAKGVVTVSNSERERIAKSLLLPQDRIFVSYNGLSQIWFDLPKSAPKLYDVLYVSNFAPHKGHLNLLAVLNGLGLKVAFVGSDLGSLGAVQAYASAAGIDVTFFQNLSEAELVELYDASKCFAFPSELEGFGIPLLEARARGVPVVANDIPIFRELCLTVGGAVVDFHDRAAAQRAIVEATRGGNQAVDLSSFAWPRIAESLFERL